jgi:thiamine kinase
MAATLPRPARLRLEQTLAQWRQWDCAPPLRSAPVLIAVLSDGHSNFSVLVGGQQRFVVRIDGINPAANGLNRQGEWRCLQVAHKAELAPRPRYFNPELGSLVCDYLPPDEHQPVNVTDVAGLLRGIHRLPPRHQRLDLTERILSYQKQLEHQERAPAGELAPYREPVLAALAAATEQAQPTVLCHHDLLRANRIYSSGKLWAIDWEYCAMGSPWYDLAVVVAGDELDGDTSARLLEAYLQRPATGQERRLVAAYCCTYRYLEILWYLVLDHPRLKPAALRDKLARLARVLGRN